MSGLLKDDLRQVLATSPNSVVFIIGTGVSLGAVHGSPCAPQATWAGLLETGLSRAHELGLGGLDSEALAHYRRQLALKPMSALIGVADVVSEALGAPRGGEYARWMRETVGTFHQNIRDRTVLEALAEHQQRGTLLATTNYDHLLEAASSLRPATWRRPDIVERTLRGVEPRILHLHGEWEDPESIVLGMRSYADIVRDEHAQAVLTTLRTDRTFVFVGCGAGLRDPNIGAFLRWTGEVFARSEARHFRLCLRSELAALRSEHPDEQRIFPLPYGDTHAELPDFLRALLPEVVPSPTGSEPPVAPESVAPEDPAPAVESAAGSAVMFSWSDWWMNTHPQGELLTIVDDTGETVTMRPWGLPVKLTDAQAFSTVNAALARWRAAGHVKRMHEHPWAHVTSALYRHEHNSQPRILIFRSMGSPPALLKYGQACELTRADIEAEGNEPIRRHIVEEKLVRINSRKDPTVDERRYSAELLAAGIAGTVDLGITPSIPIELDTKTGRTREITAEEEVCRLIKENKRASEFGLEVPLLEQDTLFDFLQTGTGLVAFTYEEYSDIRSRAMTPAEARTFARHCVASGIFSSHRDFPGGLFVGAIPGDVAAPGIPQSAASPHVQVLAIEKKASTEFAWDIVIHNFSLASIRLERASISWRFRDLGASSKYPVPHPEVVGITGINEKREMSASLPFAQIQAFAAQQKKPDPSNVASTWIYAVLELDLRLIEPMATSFRVFKELPAGPDPLRDRRRFLSDPARDIVRHARTRARTSMRRIGAPRKHFF